MFFHSQKHSQYINLDRNDEVIITLTTAYGTGVLQQEMHVLNTEELSEINIQDPIEIINKKVTSRIVENEGKVNVTVKWDEKIIATVPGAVSPSNFPITAFIEYGPDLKFGNVAISLYSVPDSTFSLPLTEIPYYQRGESVYKINSFLNNGMKVITMTR